MPSADRARDVPALLHRDRRDAVQLAAAHGDHVAEREHLRMPGDGQVGLDDDAGPARSVSRSGGVREQPRERRRGDAGRPDLRPRGDALALAVAALRPRSTARRCRRRSCSSSGVTPSERSCRSALARQRVAGTRRARGRPLRRAARAPLRVSTSRYSRGSTSRASSAICPAISTPVGPAPTTTNVSHASRAAVVGLDLRRLEREQDPVAQVERAVERLQLRRVLGPVVVAEVRVARAAGDGEHVVRRASALAAVRQVVDGDASAPRDRTRSPRRGRRARSAAGAAPCRSGIATSTDESEPVATW